MIISDFQNSTLLENSENLAVPSYFFKGLEIKLLNKEQLYAREIEYNNRSIDEKIELFTKLAQRLEKTFSVQLMDNSTLSIGYGKHEIFYANGLVETHLVGNGGENVYTILPVNQTVFPLSTTLLYDTFKSQAYDFAEPTDTLVLYEIVKKTKQICQHEFISFDVTPLENDLNLDLSADCPNPIRIATIKLKAALVDNWYQKLDIFLDDTGSSNIIAIDNATFALTPAPLIFNSNKEIILTTNKDIKKGLEILILKNIGNYRFFRNQTDLILTNVLTNTDDYCTLICHQFYALAEMREKMLSVVFNFFDQSVRVQNNLTEINAALNFSDLYIDQFNNSSTTFNPMTAIPIQSSQELSLKIDRSKRQINSKNLTQFEQFIQTSQPLEDISYFWAILGVGTITASIITFIASLRFLVIRKRLNSRGTSLVVPMLSAAITSTQFLRTGVQAHELPKLRKQNQLGSSRKIAFWKDCVKSASPMGIVGICAYKHGLIFWQQINSDQASYFESYLLNRTESNNHYLAFEGGGQWILNLGQINQTALENIYYLLPPKFYQRLATQSARQQIFIIWQKQLAITMGHYIGGTLFLHTPLGNVFKTVGLLLNWQEHDEVHFLNRCGITIQQLLSHLSLSEKFLSSMIGLIEVTLLHPHTQSMYAYLTNNGDFSKAKSVIRFMGDLLQLGAYNLFYLTRLLEFFFPKSESILRISLGIRMASHFYWLTEDVSYWYLGMALYIYCPI